MHSFLVHRQRLSRDLGGHLLMATFETLASKCAAGVALDLLVAIANIESGI